MPGEFHQKDFIESMFYQDLELSQELFDYATSYDMETIDHVETSFYKSEMDLRLAELTMSCVEDFFIEIRNPFMAPSESVGKQVWTPFFLASGVYPPATSPAE